MFGQIVGNIADLKLFFRVIVIASQDHNYQEAKSQLYHMGAHFEALYIGILMAGSD